MGFASGGGGVLTNHTHDTAVTNDGGALAANATMFGLSNGSILYSDGSNIQELGVGSDTQVLAISGSTPSWITNTANPLVKVTKSYTDIDVGTTSMDIYTLPVDSALVNVWTDITTVFDVSTAVTIGDAGDANGFQEATDWTSGTGLTDATRGAYVTSFKTMRSTSGTTAIKAYGFSTDVEFIQSTGGGGDTIQESARQELAQQFNAGQVLIGEDVISCTWFLLRNNSPTGTIQAYIKQADGTIKTTSSTTVDASTVPVSYAEYKFDFAATTIDEDDMLTITLDNGSSSGSNSIRVNEDGTANMTDGLVFSNSDTASPSYTPIDPAQIKMTVVYQGATSDTQGEVDFYLQVVD